MVSIWNNFNDGKAQGINSNQDRKPAVAGRFYPKEERALRDTLRNLFLKARPSELKNVRAIICPHAGYIFSGEVAASGFNQADPEKQYDNVFLIASSHQLFFEGASVYNTGDYITPLGKVKVNKELADNLIKKSKVFNFRMDADRTEHSTEVQVPFLQYHLKRDFKLVPIVIGTQSASICKEIASALKPYFNERNLFVISTDFAHYPSYDDAVKTDRATCDAIVSSSPEKLLELLDRYRDKEIPNLATNLCGWTSVITLLELIGGSQDYKIVPVQYKNSGDTPYGDKNQVVGYWSLAVTHPETSFDFTADEKTTLLKLARATIDQYLKEGKIAEQIPDQVGNNLRVHAGAFVTLKKDGELRGCIGRFSANIPLYQVIRQMSVASATQDSRFSPVTLKELSSLEIEISVLSPMKKISSEKEIIPGKHGIYMKKGYASGTFLPQVATEYQWNREEFLGHCARDKAGIGWDGWKTAELWTYEACVFSERDFNARKD